MSDETALRALLVGTRAAPLAQLVRAGGFEVEAVSTLGDARRRLAAWRPVVVVADQRLADGEAAELLEDVQGSDAELVVVTAGDSVERAADLLHRGAMDFLAEPVDEARLATLLAVARGTSELKEEVSSLRRELREAGRFGTMVGASPAIQQVYELVERVARTDATVFVTGESGTGKELVANAIHRLGPRRKRPFLPLNCGAISRSLIESELFGHERGAFTGAERKHQGHFERAHRGTLFLDEITEMPYELQVKLLRVLETGSVLRVGGSDPVRVDVRTIVASNRDPEEAVREEALREDLYYRLRVFPIHLPPLRDREGDVELLARHFVGELNRRHDARKSLSDEAVDLLIDYSWPGNVRELKNVVERSFILAEKRITRSELPRNVRLGEDAPMTGDAVRVPIGTPLAEAEKQLILATLDRFDGSRKDTAEALGISTKTLYNRLKGYEREKED